MNFLRMIFLIPLPIHVDITITHPVPLIIIKMLIVVSNFSICFYLQFFILTKKSKIFLIININFLATPNSTLDSNISTNNMNNVVSASNIISADSSVASSISLDDEDESPIKVKKKDEKNVSNLTNFILNFNRYPLNRS